jgi:hypothetical protein
MHAATRALVHGTGLPRTKIEFFAPQATAESAKWTRARGQTDGNEQLTVQTHTWIVALRLKTAKVENVTYCIVNYLWVCTMFAVVVLQTEAPTAVQHRRRNHTASQRYA